MKLINVRMTDRKGNVVDWCATDDPDAADERIARTRGTHPGQLTVERFDGDEPDTGPVTK